MSLVWSAIYWVLFLYFLLLIGRLILSWVQVFSPRWRPTGIMLVVAEIIYTPTDPPLKAIGRVLPPLNLGVIRLDLAFIIVFFVVYLLMQVAQAQARV